jgi:hypothetical protein
MSGFHVCKSGGYISFEPATTTFRLKLGTVNIEDGAWSSATSWKVSGSIPGHWGFFR